MKGMHMTSKSNTTIDHDEIRQWVEEHAGKPAYVRGTEDGDDAGVLRIDFPGGAGEDQLEHISWEEWFAKFEDSDLAFLYQEEKASARTAPSSSSSGAKSSSVTPAPHVLTRAPGRCQQPGWSSVLARR